MLATDSVTLGDVRVSDSGYLEAFAHTARTGIQKYHGAEMGRPDLGVVNVYRDADDVFSKQSLHSFSKIPVTVDHPATGVNAGNWKQVAVGTTGEEVLRDGERLKIGLKIMDQAAIAAVRAGKRELSVGYRTEIVWGDGVAPDGTPYQARQTAIVADHIAIVAAGRAGPQCRIGDSWPVTDTSTPNPSRETVMKTLTIDGHSVELSDAAIIAVGNLQKQLGTALSDAQAKDAALTKAGADHKAAIEAKDAAHATALKTKDTELATKDAEIEKLKSAVLDDAALDKLVTDRADVIGKARAIVADVKTEGVSIPAIRRAVVTSKLGDAAVKDKSDDYVEARFDLLADSLPKGSLDPVRKAIATGATQTADANAAPHARYVQNMRDAWKAAPSGASAA